MLHVCPETNGVGEFFPHSFVFPDTLFTVLDERLQTILLNLLLAVQSQHLLYFQLNRKTVGIPSSLSRNHVALHRAVSRNHILDNTGQHMSDVRLAVCGRRSVIECIGRSLLTAVDTLLKNLLIFPELLNVLFTFHEIHVCRNFVVHDKFLLKI